MRFNRFLIFLLAFSSLAGVAQQAQYVSKVWSPDLGNGTYKNPILHADYSDPDAIRVNDDFYLVSSSFEDIPGLPILHSKDLVNWSIIGYALKRQPPVDYYSKVQHGAGVWAPSMRFHNNEFYIYYPDPDFGIYMVKAPKPEGPWSEPVLVEAGKGLIDPCPLWDDDGKVYLVHAFAGSRAGIKSVLAVKRMNPAGTKVTEAGRLVIDGHEKDPTLEGPKFYKRNGFYYIFAPAGGVSTGWQVVFRSKNIYGPYERKVVMEQGKTSVNGPHQGAWVTTQTGEDWFLHFQDKEAYGRIVHLQPMAWKDNWPVIGSDPDHDGIGNPVMTYKKPNVGKAYPVVNPAESDEFNGPQLGLQWQWMANPKATWSFLTAEGKLRLYTDKIPDSAVNLWQSPNMLLQKFPAESFTVTTKVTFHPNAKNVNESTGLTVMGFSYAGLSLKKNADKMQLVFTLCNDARKGKKPEDKIIETAKQNAVYFRVKVIDAAKCKFSYSYDGIDFTDAGDEFQAEVGQWIGAKVGIYSVRESQTNDSGYADYDWFRVEPVK
ncbi:family 43 glycosylhydrolase [Pedobacter sp. HMF7647]|uniref:Family 43 glycosylhydrolase n=1 Tax=Hufsiella arboris TaxID=2695275 RepID=A0A7K1Y4J7_9SPHI|nr:glycoside hydrolase 43 family protein [Hufsiella arboris]MXV49493.1 family 43 glycosylhydrolase [Hufsiella arboris]